jgi:DNA-directed RNA polymerase subunit RPC12/RpoP
MYKISSDEQVLDALSEVFKKRRLVGSQGALKRLVDKELRILSREEKRGKVSYKVSQPRLRLLAIKSGKVEVEIHSRESMKKTSMSKCPVCSSRVKRVKNLTVWGGTVTLGYQCKTCGYWTGIKRRIPTRYVFSRH